MFMQNFFHWQWESLIGSLSYAVAVELDMSLLSSSRATVSSSYRIKIGWSISSTPSSSTLVMASSVLTGLPNTVDITSPALFVETIESEDGWVLQASPGLQSQVHWSQTRLCLHINAQELLVPLIFLQIFPLGTHQFVFAWTFRWQFVA